MVTIPKLKVNNFKEVSIPKPSDLFARFGFSNKKGTYSGDENALPSGSKVEQIAQVEKIAIEEED